MLATRRSFLRGALSVLALPVLPKLALAGALPVIYGDGERDDWAGLQAMFNGEPFHVEAADIVADAEGMKLFGGVYRLSRTLVINSAATLVRPRFRMALDFDEDEPLLHLGRDAGPIELLGIGWEGKIEFDAPFARMSTLWA